MRREIDEEAKRAIDGKRKDKRPIDGEERRRREREERSMKRSDGRQTMAVGWVAEEEREAVRWGATKEKEECGS